ncbi:MAG TPA: substrate-binding domain-containing protein [Alphaproteobacteria bacterium]|nr:substrate-binding domain-containing protein [Alphaproteobacteria bacterium]
MKPTSVLLGSMAASIALAATVVTPAHAATVTGLYGGGSTLVEKVYRDLFNAYGSTSGNELCAGLTTTCPTSHYNAAVELLYVGVGSGNGKKALNGYDPTLYVTGDKKPDATPTPSGHDLGIFYGTGFGASWQPGTGTGPYYPKVTFSGSDDVLGSSDVSAVAALGFGPVIQLPGLVAAIAVPFKPIGAGWNPKGVKPVGGSSQVQLSTNTLCGIFTGAITNWNDPEIQKDNKNVKLGTGKITVAYRNDGSGTTFIFSNALLNQCGTQSHRAAKSTHPIPDKWVADNGLTYKASVPHWLSNTSFFINVFNAHDLPSNFLNNKTLTGVTGGASGSGGIKAAINATPGSIGYVSPDFVLPVDASGPQAANLQTLASHNAGSTPVYVAPTATGATLAMASAKPPAFPTAAKDPLNWGAVAPRPTGLKAYPISGFSFIDLYSCYSSATDVAALVGKTAGKYGYLTWYYGAGSVNKNVPKNILAADGFAPVPPAWATAINKLLVDPNLGIGTPKKGATAGTKACRTVTKGA